MNRIWIVACVAALAGCGASSSTSPTVSAVPASISVTGSTALTVGDSVQFKAVSSSGQDITIGALWKTSDTRVASVSTFGAVVAIGPGSASISATLLGVTGQIDVPVTPSLLQPPMITRCGDITQPGAYSVAADISLPAPNGTCITIRSSGVELNCADHLVSGIYVLAASNVTVQHCTDQAFAFALNSTNVTFHHNHLATIIFDGGSNNTIRDNTIDGGYDGSGGLVGEDDGVLLENEHDDTVINNDIRNVWDAGIETTDAVTNTLIANNTIDNTGSTAIGAYWCTAWTGNTVSGNRATRTPGLMFFDYRVGVSKCRDAATVGLFVNNRFIGNRYSQPTKLQESGSMTFSLGKLDRKVTNNLIQGNDMGESFGPDATPENGFIDGGGNICKPGTSIFCGLGGTIR